MSTLKSWIITALLAGSLLAGCAPQPIQSPPPGATGGITTSTTGPAERNSTPEPAAQASPEPLSTGGGTGNGSIQTPSPSPIPGGGTANAVPDVGIVLTLDNSGETLTLKPGETFLLKLGEAYDWQIIIADQTVVSRVKNVMVIRGAQGLYTALQPGQTEFSAQGDPLCRKAKPACGLASVLFRQTIIVQ